MFENAKLLITGGTGSFGNAVLRRFLKTGISEIRIFSRDEKKQDDMRHEYRDPRLRFYIGDVRNLDSLLEATAGTDCVFHAAALKQVPSCEFYPVEAIRTNSLGTDNLLQAATTNNVKRVVVLSTDKAAYPINAMGMSKALSEKIMVARSRVAAEKNLVFCGTRYGNVMASRGSVIPLFIQQIEGKKPLTVTDPNMTRFMMTLENAVELVVYAFEHANPGDMFVQKAPAATLITLIEALKKLLQADNEIKVIGTRHGEKLYETLLTREEMVRSEDLPGYFRVRADARDLNYNLFFSEGQPLLNQLDDYHSHNTERLDVNGMIKLLLELSEVREAMQRRGVKP
ncbi:MAG TPA: polysaccharide biosynthesis protein [Pyrinomonadaceae bacterium]|nr:polysaccharide biosynthesis protein [Pyrinomonadaceae bacterium]